MFDHRELIDGQPVIVIQHVKIDKPRQIGLDHAIIAVKLNGGTLGYELVETAVLLDERRVSVSEWKILRSTSSRALSGSAGFNRATAAASRL